GLAIRPVSDDDVLLALSALRQAVECVKGRWRLVDKVLVDFVVGFALKAAARHHIPVQFHVGVGDKEVDLIQANPILLRQVLEDPTYRDVKFILLHNYPYAKEAGYLASMYANVFADFGESDLILSSNGVYQTLRELLHMAPTTKIQFSTDGHHHPETYYIGAKWGREALADVLCETVDSGDLTPTEALTAAADILFRNANRIYALGWDFPVDLADPASSTALDAENASADLIKNGVKLIRVTWVDNGNVARTKLIPPSRLQIAATTGLGLVSAVFGLHPAADVVVTGTDLISATHEGTLRADLSTLVRLPYHPAHAAVLASYHDREGKPFPVCARTFLHRTLTTLSKTHNLTLRAGYELEFQLMDPTTLSPIDDTKYAQWAALNSRTAPVIDAIVGALEQQGIEVELVHAESGSSQFEIVMRNWEGAVAADRLVWARQTIYNVATSFNLKATFVPRFSEMQAGNANHVHLSLWRGAENIYPSATSPIPIGPETQHFIAGILHHLPALMAITIPSVNSYDRMVPGIWAGAFECWGFEEAPIRALADHFELKTMDVGLRVDGVGREACLSDP
ncbi:hypothetical protein BDK51DRAFT_38961, partial [Blyttiomyces helicus]